VGSCTLYFSRQATHDIATKLAQYQDYDPIAIGTAFGVACAPFVAIPLPVVDVAAYTICNAIGNTYGTIAIHQFQTASKRNTCIGVKASLLESPYVGSQPTIVDRSQYCH
jgi:hypothetical protein